MATVTAIVAGPTRGAGRPPRVWTGAAQTAADAIVEAKPRDVDVPVSTRPPICFVNGQDTRFAQGDDTALGDGDVVLIVYPATDL